MKIKNQNGIALVISLFVLVFLLGLSSVFILRTVNERNTVRKEIDATKSFYISDGGSQDGLNGIDTLINNYMLNTVNATNPSTIVSNTQSYVTSGDGLALLMAYVKNGGVAQLTLNGAQAEYNVSNVSLNGGTYGYKVILTEKSNPTQISTDIWDFPFYYRVESKGGITGFSKEVLLSGDFTVRVQKDNFAKYALFTNNQTLPNGTNVWFTSLTNFAGPLHTNNRYNIAFNPSGTFDGLVTQVQSTARFYNNGSTVLINADNNGTIDVPTFNMGFNRSSSSVTLTSPSQKTDMIAQATGGETFVSNGIYVPNSGGSLTGGIYVKGDAAITLGVDGSNNPLYTINAAGTTKKVTVDLSANQTTVETVGVSTTTYTGKPTGVDQVGTIIYTDGNITSLAGTIQRDTEMTIASESDITVTDNLQYQDYTPASGTPGVSGYVPPSADGYTNLLGVVTWSGDVYVGTGAPNNVNIHGTVLAKAGIIQVNNYNDQGVGGRGTATLLGGAIQDYYGAFGLYNGSTGQLVAGYGRNFVYDQRLLTGNSPPYFPTLNTFVAFTNDITDKITWQEGDGS